MNSGTYDGETIRSGGKITKRRRITTGKTPYDRPTQPIQPEKPYWYTGLVFPAKFVAGGATKLISSVWNPIRWNTNSNSSDTDSDSEGGIENDNEGDAKLSDGGAELDQNKGSSSEKSEVLYLVEQLLMIERYSREECDRLINIINSRVVDYTMREGVDDGPKNPDICNQMIMDARKLITENMVGSSIKSDLDNNVHGSKSLITPNVSLMPQRDYLSGGAWNIENEIQRLRSKTIEVTKPNQPISSEAPKPEDKRATQGDVPIEVLSSLPTIQEQNQMTEKKDVEDDKMGGDVNLVEGNSDLVTEYTEVPDVIASQGSSNTNEPTSTKKPDIQIEKRVTRSRRYTKRGRGRGK